MPSDIDMLQVHIFHALTPIHLADGHVHVYEYDHTT